MDDHRSLALLVFRADIRQVEANGQLEVQLDRPALEGPPERVEYRNVNLRAVECAVAGIQFPRPAELRQRPGQLLAP